MSGPASALYGPGRHGFSKSEIFSDVNAEANSCGPQGSLNQTVVGRALWLIFKYFGTVEVYNIAENNGV